MGDKKVRVTEARWSPERTRWELKVQLHGVRKSFYSSVPGIKGKRECNRKADEWLEEMQVDKVQEEGRTVREIGDECVARRMNSDSTTKGTNEALARTFRLYVYPNIGSMGIKTVTKKHLQAILNSAAVQGAKGKPLRKGSLHCIRSDIYSLVNYAIENGDLDDVSFKLVIPSYARKSTARRALTNDEIQILLSSEDSRLYLYQFLVLTGLRVGELIGLMWSDIDGNIIHVKRNIARNGDIHQGKTKNAQREFIMMPRAVDILNKLPRDGEYVFSDIKHQHLLYATVFTRWARLQKELGIGVVTLHELRHTFITVAEGQVSLTYVQGVVGHNASMNTFEVYGHKKMGMDVRQANELGELFEQIVTKEMSS